MFKNVNNFIQNFVGLIIVVSLLIINLSLKIGKKLSQWGENLTEIIFLYMNEISQEKKSHRLFCFEALSIFVMLGYLVCVALLELVKILFTKIQKLIITLLYKCASIFTRRF